LIKHQVVLFPSEAVPYESEERLTAEIRAYIHRYVDVTPLFETIAVHYVLLSWVYEGFNELPYLRLRGDFGSGKTRFLKVVGSICFRPVFASGASSISPLFRILDSFRGTLLIDEGDFRMSDEKAELVKILNNGNARGFPVLRSEQSRTTKEFNPVAYSVFGPKLLASRGYFDDRALESRFISEDTGGHKLRPDIPINLPPAYEQEALALRNKLLSFRFQSLHRHRPLDQFIDRMIEPRLAQIFSPLLSMVADESVRLELQQLARQYSGEIAADREMDVEAHILEIIQELLTANPDRRLSVGEVTKTYERRHGDEHEKRPTAKWIGTIIRKRLKLKTTKSHGNYVILTSELVKLPHLYERYGVTDGNDDPGGLGDVGEVAAE
jgi:hypothetical protein